MDLRISLRLTDVYHTLPVVRPGFVDARAPQVSEQLKDFLPRDSHGSMIHVSRVSQRQSPTNFWTDLPHSSSVNMVCLRREDRNHLS